MKLCSQICYLSVRCYLLLKLLSPDIAVFICEFTAENHNKVNEPADSTRAACQQPDNACADFSRHKSMYAETSQKKCNYCCCTFTHNFTPFKLQNYRKILFAEITKKRFIKYYIHPHYKFKVPHHEMH